MPAKQGGGEVRGSESVDCSGQGGARDAVEHGEIPRYLGAVDAEMRGDGAGAALRGQEIGAGGLGCGCCCCLSVLKVLTRRYGCRAR